ncbi:MAG: porin [Paraglaciecola sp.]|nr:porin [Paraglaciecola sp.]
MSKKNIVLTSFFSACLTLSLPLTALAQEKEGQNDTALLERLNQLEQEISAIKDKLNAVATDKVEIDKKLSTKNDTSVKWKGAPEVKSQGGWSIKPRGRMLYDFSNLSSVPSSIDIPGEGFSNEARRVRLGIQGSMPGGFAYKLEADFLDGTTLTDAYLDYKSDGLKIIIGQHNNFQGLEELSSSNDTSFIERAAFTDAFGFERKVGISASYKVADINLEGGVFTDNIDNLNDGNNSHSVDVRAYLAPKIEGKQWHVGASVHWRNLAESTDTVRYRARPMVHTVDTRFINTNNIAGADTETGLGLEFGLIADRFHAMAEMYSLMLDRNGFEDASFFGGAIEAGYFLTNDARQYQGGIFKGVKVSEPLGAGGMGAWQINVRFDRLDLVDADIVGGTQNAYMTSLIWTPVNNVRFLVNYGHIKYSDALGIVEGAPQDFSVNVVGARTQVSF